VTASIVVPVRDGERVIAGCLRSLSLQDFPGEDYEIIVVDDGSTDTTAKVVEQFPHVRLIAQPPLGPAAARNRGIRAARGEIVLFTDADCAPEPGWVRNLVTGIRHAGAAGAKGTYATQQQGLVARFVQVEYETKYRRLARQDTIDFVDTYSAAYRRSVLQEVKGFDERFTTASVEDQELSFRVARRGHHLVFLPGARVGHLHATTPWAYARKKFRIGYWKPLVLKEHPSKTARDSHTPQLLKVQIALTGLLGLSCLAALLEGRIVAGPLAVAAALLVSWGPFLAYAARRDPATLLVAPLLLLVRAAALGVGLVWGTLHLRRLAG
jgi:glycosyltransferase involved in cell wall biosynthesis